MHLNCSFHYQRIVRKKCHGRKVFNLQMSLAMVEMSGPLAAVLQQQTASSPSDFQAYLFGRRILSYTSMATDSEENKKVETTKLVITKFVVAKAEDDIFKGKTISNEHIAVILKTSKGKTYNDRNEFLGFLSFKKFWSTSQIGQLLSWSSS